MAIKALPDAFARDAERRARFEREARLLGSLNHANIATLFGIEEAEGAVYLVLELIEGEGLEQKVAGGPLPLGEALGVASPGRRRSRGGARSRDHPPRSQAIKRQGPPGRHGEDPRLRARAEDRRSGRFRRHRFADRHSGGTGTGIVLGTAAYMSPEQARGKPLDRRTDVFSFGCLLYELLTGERAFKGQTVSDTMAAVLTAEPDWTAPGADVPPRVNSLLRRCLQKDSTRRLRDIGDARLEVEEIRVERTETDGAGRRAEATCPAATAPTVFWGLAGLVAGALVVFAVFRATAAVERRSRASRSEPSSRCRKGLQVLGSAFYPTVAVSPDGGTVVFRAGDAGGRTRLYRRTSGEWSRRSRFRGRRGAGRRSSLPTASGSASARSTELMKVALSGASRSGSRISPGLLRSDLAVRRHRRRGPLEQQRPLSRVAAGGPLERLRSAGRGSRRTRASLAAGAAGRPGSPRHDRPGRGLPGDSERRDRGRRAPLGKAPGSDREKHVRPFRPARPARFRARWGRLRRTSRPSLSPCRGDARRRAGADLRRRLGRHRELRRHSRRDARLRFRAPHCGDEFDVSYFSTAPDGKQPCLSLWPITTSRPSRPTAAGSSCKSASGCRASSMSSTGSAAFCRRSPPSRGVSSRPSGRRTAAKSPSRT